MTTYQKIEQAITGSCSHAALPLARVSLFIVYFWFGILKVVDASPANPLVADLLERTLPFIGFNQFIVAFGLFEMLIGIVFLIPRLDKLAIILFVLHMLSTLMPLIMLPAVAWSAPLVPTLEGQYIIKNIALIALAVSIAASHRREHHSSTPTTPA